MSTWIAITKDGRTKHISAYTESDANEQAVAFAGDQLLQSLELI